MATLQNAKAEVLKQFKTSLPPGVPDPTQFTLPNMLTRPILTTGTLSNGAHNVIAGTFEPGSDNKAAEWSTADPFTTTYLNMIQNMAYGYSTADQNQMTTLKTDNQVVLNDLVTIWEKNFGRITDEQLKTAPAPNDKVTYVITQFTPAFKTGFNWPKFAGEYNKAKAAIDIMSNLNSAAVTFGEQLTAIKANLADPSASDGGIEVYDTNNNKVWQPGYNVDPNFPSKFKNGQTVSIEIDLMDVGTDSSSFSIGGKVGGSFSIGFLEVGGSTSAEYKESHFKKLMSKVKIKLEYKSVSYLATSPINLTESATKIGWYAPGLLKQAYNRGPDDTGPYFVSDAVNQKNILKNGSLQSVAGFLVSPMPSGTMQFETDDYESFQKYFHTETEAHASLFGIIPIASVNTSYTKASSGATDKGYGMEVQINNSGDQNNLVVHGAVMQNPLS